MIIIIYKIKINNRLKEDRIIISCSPKCRELAENMLLFIHQNHIIPTYNERNQINYIPIFNIYYIEIVDQYIFAYTKNNCYKVNIKFHVLSEMVKQYNIKQINRNTLVNLNFVISSKIISDCRRQIQLKNNETLIVSRKYLKDYMTFFENKKLIK